MIIDSIKAKKILSKRCMEFLIHVVQKSIEIIMSIKDTLMVQKFPDVFFNNLPRLILKRKLKFSIELVLRAIPISKTLYKIAPTELKKLKKQLQELLNNGLIRLSHLPWGNPLCKEEISIDKDMH